MCARLTSTPAVSGTNNRSAGKSVLGILSFGPDGRVICLYSDLIDLRTIGRLKVRRLTHIEFDSERQYWRVRDRTGFAMFNSPSRTECLDWEQRYFTQHPEQLGAA